MVEAPRVLRELRELRRPRKRRRWQWVFAV
jgi:hypothetical protein